MPFGDESNDPTTHGLDSDNEGATELERTSPAAFRMPPGYAATLPRETHKSDHVGSSPTERRESPTKKRKKHRKEKDGSSQAPVASQSSMAKSSSQVHGSEAHVPDEAGTNGVSHRHDGESAEEKAKRRAEREKRR